MAKDSQIDPKHIREAKANKGATLAQSENDGEGKSNKKSSIK